MKTPPDSRDRADIRYGATPEEVEAAAVRLCQVVLEYEARSRNVLRIASAGAK